MSLISKLNTLAEHPTLLKTIGRKVSRGFVKGLLIAKEKFGFIPNTVIDIGAALGEWSKAANFVYPDAKIYAFEPIPDSLKQAKEALKDILNIEFFNIALFSSNEKKQFHLNEFTFSSSLLKMTDKHKEIYPFTKNETVINVECKRFDTLTGIILENPVYVKMDVQGAELEVLKGFGNLIQKIDMVQIELGFEDFYENQFNYADIFNFFFENGFKSFLQLDLQFNKNKLIYCDYIFVR